VCTNQLRNSTPTQPKLSTKKSAHKKNGTSLVLREKKIRILRVIARLNIGGPAIHTVLLTSALNNDKFETQLVAGKVSEQEGDMAYLAETVNVSTTFVPQLQREISFAKDLKAFLALWRIINQYKPDIIHTHTAKAGLLGRFCTIFHNLLHQKKIKIVHTFHGHVFHGYFSSFKTSFFINLERFLSRFTDRIITITKLQQKEILSFGVGSERQHKVIALGLDLDKFYQMPRKKGEFRKKYDIPETKVLVGTVARFVPIKNLALFLQVAKLLLKERDDMHFVMVGDGEEKEDLKNLVKELQIEDFVTFTGFLKDLPEVYSDLDLMMLTSNNEGSPVSIIEAMTAGVPVVASQVGGVPDLFLPSSAKWLCEPKNPFSFKKAVDSALSEPDETRQIVEVHRTETYKKYNFHRLVNDLTLEYQNLMS